MPSFSLPSGERQSFNAFVFEKHFEVLEEGAREERSVITQINCFCLPWSHSCDDAVPGGSRIRDRGRRVPMALWTALVQSHLDTNGKQSRTSRLQSGRECILQSSVA